MTKLGEKLKALRRTLSGGGRSSGDGGAQHGEPGQPHQLQQLKVKPSLYQAYLQQQPSSGTASPSRREHLGWAQLDYSDAVFEVDKHPVCRNHSRKLDAVLHAASPTHASNGAALHAVSEAAGAAAAADVTDVREPIDVR